MSRSIDHIIGKLPRGSITLPVIGLATVILGFIREAVVAFYFGITAELDSFLVALSLPKLLAAQALLLVSAAIVPRYVKAAKSEGSTAARLLGQRWVVISALSGVVIVTVLFAVAPLVMAILGPGLTSDAKEHSTSWFLMLLPYTGIVIVAAAFKGLLDSRQRFAPGALANLVISTAVICACALGANELGINAIVVGMSIGAIACLVWQMTAVNMLEPGSLRFGVASFSTNGLPISGLLLLFVGSIAGQGRMLVDRAFVSHLDPGSIAALNYAEVLTSLPSTILASAIATILLPKLSALIADRKHVVAFWTCCRWAGIIAAASLIPVILLVVFRVEVVAFVFERGAFGTPATLQTSGILVVLPCMIVLTGISVIVNRLFIAYERTAWIAGLGLLSLGIKVLLNALWIGSYGLIGIALSTVVSAALVTGIRFVALWYLSTEAGAEETDRPSGNA